MARRFPLPPALSFARRPSQYRWLGEVRCVAFMGELSDISVADLLYLLSLRRQSGKLSISANGDEVNLFLSRGQLALVTSSNLTLRLGRMLVRLGMLDGIQLK